MNSRDYWEHRAMLLELLTEHGAEDTIRQLSRCYGLAQEEIVRQIERVFERYVKKGGTLNERQAMQLLSQKQTQEFRQELLDTLAKTKDRKLSKEIRHILDAPAYANRISRLQALRDRIYVEARKAGLQEIHFAEDRLADVLEQSRYRTAYNIQQYEGVGWNVDKLSDNRVKAVIGQKWEGGNYSSRIWNNNQQFADAVQDVVTTGILSGQTYRDMRDRLLYTIGEDPTQGARYKSARLIRTECNHVANQGIKLGMEEAELGEYQYIATLDLRTSEICRSLDLKIFLLSEAQTGVNYPPMHPNCRSVVRPVLSPEVMARHRRAARDPVTGKYMLVPASMTYREWYAKYVTENPEAAANEQKIQNKYADQKQWEQYRALLGSKAPKSVVSFQRMKYNESEKWDALQQEAADQRIRNDILGGKYKTTVNPEKQSWHILDSEGYKPGRSYLLIPESDMGKVQELVDQYKGTGEIFRAQNNSQIREIIDTGREIGVVLNNKGEEIVTTKVKIHYSRTGVHIIPYIEKGKEEG